jgi:hypothetical protein
MKAANPHDRNFFYVHGKDGGVIIVSMKLGKRRSDRPKFGCLKTRALPGF